MQENTTRTKRGTNLTQADRERGGKVSSSKQVRDARGQFAGAKGRSAHTNPPHVPRLHDREGRHGNGQGHHPEERRTAGRMHETIERGRGER